MSKTTLPKDFDKKEEEKISMIVLPTAEKTLEQIKRFTDVTIYGFLLNPDPKHPLAQVLRERWSEIHYLTGENVLITATEAPIEWSKNLKEYWESKLGAEFKKIWEEWQKRPEAGIAFQYLDLFTPHLDQSQLPCLVLFTDPDERQAVVRSLPAWDENSLYELIRNILGTVCKCATQPDKIKRFECLEHSLTSQSAIILANLDHIKDTALDYIKKNPAKVLTTTISFVLALATGNVLALGPAAVTVLKAIKDTIS